MILKLQDENKTLSTELQAYEDKSGNSKTRAQKREEEKQKKHNEELATWRQRLSLLESTSRQERIKLEKTLRANMKELESCKIELEGFRAELEGKEKQVRQQVCR